MHDHIKTTFENVTMVKTVSSEILRKPQILTP
jgi:hypothetical protein